MKGSIFTTLFLASLSLITTSFAQNQSVSTLENEKSKPVDYTLSSGLSSSFLNPSDDEYTISNDWNFSLSAAVLKNYKVSANFDFSQDLTDDREFSVPSDPFLSFSRSAWTLTKGLKFSVGLRTYLPLTEKSMTQDSLLLGIMLTPSLTYDFSSLGVKNLSMTYGLRPSMNFHRFNTNINNGSNNQFRISQSLAFNYDVTEKIAVNLSGGITNNWTYSGFLKQSYSLSQEISYVLNDQWDFALGHSNAEGLLSANGESTNIDLFDPQTSSWSLSGSFHF